MQIKHEVGQIVLSRLSGEVFRMTEEEAVQLFGNRDKEDPLYQAIQEAKAYNRKQKSEKIAQLELELKKLKGSL